MTTSDTHPETGSPYRLSSGKAPDEQTWGARWCVVGVGILTLILFIPAVRFGFTGWDDGAYITTNADMRGPGGLVRIWTSFSSEQYYPLTFTSYWIEHQLWGIDPTGYHVVNLILHAVNACLVLLFMRGAGLSRALAVSATLLFSFHPVQVMSVAWIPGRKNLLSAFFALLALLAWTHFRRGGRARWYVAAFLAFALGILSKSAVVTLPLVFVVFDALVVRLSWRRICAGAIPLVVVSCASCIVTVLFEHKFLLDPPGIGERSLIAASAVWWYLFRLAMPLGLSPFYPPWDISMSGLACYLSVAGVAGLGAVFWLLRRRQPRIVFGAVLFLALLLPTLGIVPYGNMAITNVSDHYLYLACAGVFSALAVALERACRGSGMRRFTIAALVAANVAFAILSFRYLATFEDARSMWTHTLKSYADCYPAHVGLGHFYLGSGDPARAISHYRRASEILPNLPEAHVRLGNATLRYGDIEVARSAFERAKSLRPESVGATFGLAVVAERSRDSDRARRMYRQVVELDGGHCQAHLGLAAIALREGAIGEGIRHSETAIQFCPEEPRAYLGLATCLRRARRSREALAVLDRGLASVGDDTRLMNFTARILATDPDDTVRDGARALALAERACSSGDYTNYELLDTLATAYAEVGRFAEAEDTARRAARHAEAAGASGAARAFLERALRYSRREPLREIAVGAVAP